MNIALILAHFNTNRKSPFHKTWQQTIFHCLEQVSCSVTCIDWGSFDGSNTEAHVLCYERGYAYHGLEFRKNWRWAWYWRKVLNIIENTHAENIIYIEADTYFRCDDDMLEKYTQAMKKHNLDAIKMCRMVADGIRPHWVGEQLSDESWLLPVFPRALKRIGWYDSKKHEMLSESKIISRLLWNSQNWQCMLVNRKAFLDHCSTIDFSRGHIAKWRECWSKFDPAHRTGLMDNLFGFNYGEKFFEYDSEKCSPGKNILDQHWNQNISEFCPESIQTYSSGSKRPEKKASSNTIAGA